MVRANIHEILSNMLPVFRSPLFSIIGFTSANPVEDNAGQLPLKNYTLDQSLKNYFSSGQEKMVRLSSFGITKTKHGEISFRFNRRCLPRFQHPISTQ